MHRLNQITEHAISEFQRLRIAALEKENAKLVADNQELTCANKLAHERIKELEETADAVSKAIVLETKVRHDVEKENISLHNAKQTLLSKCSEFEQTIVNLKRDLVSRQTR